MRFLLESFKFLDRQSNIKFTRNSESPKKEQSYACGYDVFWFYRYQGNYINYIDGEYTRCRYNIKSSLFYNII